MAMVKFDLIFSSFFPGQYLADKQYLQIFQKKKNAPIHNRNTTKFVKKKKIIYTSPIMRIHKTSEPENKQGSIMKNFTTRTNWQ